MRTTAVMLEVCALVPMRHVSERVPGKNCRMFAGRPLFHHVVNALLKTPSVARVVIDTDSPTVEEQAQTYFPQVDVVTRPQHLLGGDVPMTSIVQHDASLVEHDWLLQTHSTNPLLSTGTIGSALAALESTLATHDSLFSVTRLQTRLYDQHGKAINHDPSVLLRTQDLQPLFEENSNLYVFPRELALTQGRRMGDRPLMYEMDRLEAVDIDEEADFTMAEALFKVVHG